MKTLKGFTLIELLIVVAIIAILAAIAVPNFLEAQTRSKIARAKADIRSIDLAMQSYIVDHNRKPPQQRKITATDGRIYDWWGFCSTAITTPVAYMSSIPPQIFWDDTVYEQWRDRFHGSKDNQPYTFIRNTYPPAYTWPAGQISAVNPKTQFPASAEFIEMARHSGYIVYTCGPDRVDGTVYCAPEIYDPTNGTMSNGDIHRFGPGEPPESAMAGNMK